MYSASVQCVNHIPVCVQRSMHCVYSVYRTYMSAWRSEVEMMIGVLIDPLPGGWYSVYSVYSVY